jgi:hypothetical protein
MEGENRYHSSSGRVGKYQDLRLEKRLTTETTGNFLQGLRLSRVYALAMRTTQLRQKTRSPVWHAWRSLIVSRFSTKVERTVAGNKMRYLAMIGRIV